ncbi:MAG: UDP-N-acetylmuramoyl-L-alanyl-D-glutamate--2,6-diaminopimelate ligase [Planctomycetota bacterium]|jgi:UDP-N-acetylmuramoyl-L-alanyl-D-glutamate--2,6-diaminopimelate ligase
MLTDLVKQLGGRCEVDGYGPEISGVQIDSRAVGVGDLFVALAGKIHDGRRHISKAVAAGASAVLVQEMLDNVQSPMADGVPIWVHADAQGVAGRAAAQVLGDPSREMTVFAITGTNGKTTTAHILGELLKACGRRPAVLGTTGYQLAGDVFVAASHTTPDATELQRLLARHKNAGGDCVVLEVSSHALVQQRVAGLDIDFGIFTNLSRDHLDYHGDMKQYATAKSLMFSNLKTRAIAVINQDDEWSSFMSEAATRNGCDFMTYSASLCDDQASDSLTENQITNSAGAPADLCASKLRFEPDATYLTLSGMGISLARLRIPLSGSFNVSNALAATAAVLLSGASPSAVVAGLASVSPPPGRLERVELDVAHAPRVFVDYAHTPDALHNVLSSLRQSGCRDEGRILCVFGCGGDRDQGKRSEMGQVVSELADVAFVTSDNPRSEDPDQIMAEIRRGMTGPAMVFVEADRRLAIRSALRESRPRDTILIAGKGHETTQDLGSRVIDFCDRSVVQEECS